jgi:hypothetical protein
MINLKSNTNQENVRINYKNWKLYYYINKLRFIIYNLTLVLYLSFNFLFIILFESAFNTFTLIFFSDKLQ